MTNATLVRPLTAREDRLKEIARLKVYAQAEADFAKVFPKEANPWRSYGERLRDAEQSLAAFDERERLDAFRVLVESYWRYSDECSSAVAARIQRISDEQHALNARPALLAGAHVRTAPVASPEDAAERDLANRWHALERERSNIARAFDSARLSKAELEREHPFLKDLVAR